jgi:hypothetical protein
MDSTYASSLAIMRRILRLEGVLDDGDRGRGLARPYGTPALPGSD